MTRSRRATHPAFWRYRPARTSAPSWALAGLGLQSTTLPRSGCCRVARQQSMVCATPCDHFWCFSVRRTCGFARAPACRGRNPAGTIRSMTTFRLLRQTNRSSRFAQVTVEVAASSRPEVEVTATAADEHRREAELGARWALRGLPTAAKVTVTDAVITEIDTSVGDVYEATAHAVWQALRVEHRAPYVGFSDPEMVASCLTSMSVRRLDAVTEARHWHEGRRASDAESPAARLAVHARQPRR